MFAARRAPWKILILAAAATGTWTPAAPADFADIRKAGKIRVVVSDGAPEFFSMNPGRDPGLECEVLKGFCQLKGLTLTMVRATSPQAAIQILMKGGAEIAAGGLPTTAGGPEVQFSTEILPSRLVIVNRKPASPILTLEELKDLKVATLRRGGEGLANGARLFDEPAASEVFFALKSGKASAGIVGVEYALPARAADGDLQIGAYIGDRMSVALGLRKDAPQLRQALDEYIGNLRRTATWNRLMLKYFGDSTSEILKASREPSLR
jgi:ABC-type amino acid transport substrate-binding protein